MTLSIKFRWHFEQNSTYFIVISGMPKCGERNFFTPRMDSICCPRVETPIIHPHFSVTQYYYRYYSVIHNRECHSFFFSQTATLCVGGTPQHPGKSWERQRDLCSLRWNSPRGVSQHVETVSPILEIHTISYRVVLWRHFQLMWGYNLLLDRYCLCNFGRHFEENSTFSISLPPTLLLLSSSRTKFPGAQSGSRARFLLLSHFIDRKCQWRDEGRPRVLCEQSIRAHHEQTLVAIKFGWNSLLGTSSKFCWQ